MTTDSPIADQDDTRPEESVRILGFGTVVDSPELEEIRIRLGGTAHSIQDFRRLFADQMRKLERVRCSVATAKLAVEALRFEGSTEIANHLTFTVDEGLYLLMRDISVLLHDTPELQA